MSGTIRIAVIGLGEAGSLIAAGLQAAGAQVVGFDPATPADAPVSLADSAAEAAAGSALLISINSATVSRRVVEEIAPLLQRACDSRQREWPPHA